MSSFKYLRVQELHLDATILELSALRHGSFKGGKSFLAEHTCGANNTAFACRDPRPFQNAAVWESEFGTISRGSVLDGWPILDTDPPSSTITASSQPLEV